MLDTNMVSHMIRFPDGIVMARADRHEKSALCVSVMTASELRYGVNKRGSSQLALLVEGALSLLSILPFEEKSTQSYADIRHMLAERGQMIGPVDLFIAAHARSLGLTMVTANVREFSRVPGLRIENWLEGVS